MRKIFVENNHIVVGLLISCIILLPGCGFIDWLKDKFGGVRPIPTKHAGKGFDVVTDGSPALVTMEGQPIVSKISVEKELKQLLKDNPQIQQMLPLMGGKEQLIKRLVHALTERQIVRRWIEQEGIDRGVEYQKELKRMTDSVRDMLNVKKFNEEHKVPSISAVKIKEFYEKHKKTMQELLVSRGGVQAMGIKFDSEDAAKDFLAKVNALKGDIEKAAEEAKFKIEDFKLVSAQSMRAGLTPELRDKIVAIQRCPAVKLFKISDKIIWVVKASLKEDPTYKKYEQVKDHLRKYLEDQEREKVLGKAMDGLKKKYKVKMMPEVVAPIVQPTPALPAKKRKPTKDNKKKVAKLKQSAQAL